MTKLLFTRFLSTVSLILAAVSLVLSQDPTNRPSPSDPFLKKWLTQDVVYIISDAERASYLGLKDDKQRYEFIEQFWKQRDPSPGTVTNQFRDEHYRRITYSNELFASKEPGWKTDRGRIYIVLGPPDQIEAHPSAQGNQTPFQIWRYRADSALNPGPERILEFTGPEYKLRER